MLQSFDAVDRLNRRRSSINIDEEFTYSIERLATISSFCTSMPLFHSLPSLPISFNLCTTYPLNSRALDPDEDCDISLAENCRPKIPFAIQDIEKETSLNTKRLKKRKKKDQSRMDSDEIFVLALGLDEFRTPSGSSTSIVPPERLPDNKIRLNPINKIKDHKNTSKGTYIPFPKDYKDKYEITDMTAFVLEEDDDQVFACSGEEILAAYKRVDRKVKPVPGVFPEDARVERQIPEDPINTLPPLTPNPPDFTPTDRLTQERFDSLKFNEDKFLLPEEERLFAHILEMNDTVLAFEEGERGTFREDYFSPYIIPVVEHVPWEFKNIPIPPGLKEKVVELLRELITAGVYEASQSSYRSRWFCVMKKNGKIRIVHDLQPLNKVTIRDAGLPPKLDDFVEPFAGCSCYTVADMFWGFYARKVDPKSRDLTSFQTPLGLLRITSLPMGFTNSPAEFQKCMVFILQEEIPHIANIFIDDLPIKGPTSTYPDQDGNPETLIENPGIRRFIWEHAIDVHRIMHKVKCAGGTFSPNKLQLARPEALIVGQRCTTEGRLPDTSKINKILNWPTPKTPKDVRGFMGLCGTVRIWIAHYSTIGRPLTELTRHNVEFIWDNRRQEAFDKLKKAVTSAPALRPIDYTSKNPVVLSVDSSKIAVGFILSQYDDNGRKRPARYGSLPMKEHESRYSQPKLELYGLYRALRHYRLYLIGVQALHVEVDAKYIKGMLNEPDLQPNATINRWIQGVLMFDFTLIHIPAQNHKGPDALSRREPSPEDTIYEEDEEW